jgi:hypothetical protein
MTTPPPIDRPASVTGAPAASGAGAAPDGGIGSLGFRRILDQLERLAAAPAHPARDSAELLAAVRRAEDEHATALDLRQRLEQAFRRYRC